MNLLERVMQATGPDREIDARVACLVQGRTFLEWSGHYYTCKEVAGSCGGDEAIVPPYTSSLDAVVALVERQMPGAEWSLSTLYGHAWAKLPLNGDTEDVCRPDGNVALALLAAFLKALPPRD